MNENAKAWVAALRSGEYGQTTCKLRRGGGCYCCLGVACDISGLGSWNEREFYVINPEIDPLSQSNAALPKPVMEWLGLSSRFGEFTGGALTDANDEGASFAQIADIIEHEPEGLFA